MLGKGILECGRFGLLSPWNGNAEKIEVKFLQRIRYLEFLICMCVFVVIKVACMTNVVLKGLRVDDGK